MKIDWEVIKVYSKEVYVVAAQVLVFELFSLYLLGCLVAAKPLGPRAYVDFADYCFHWHVVNTSGAQLPARRETAGTHGKPQN
jgi:hypothetical protein